MTPYVAQVLVVDQCSTDGSYEALKDAGVFTIRRPAMLMADPDRNFIQEIAQAEWILTHDPDERPNEGILASLPQLTASEDIDIYSYRCKHWVDGILMDPNTHEYHPRLYRKRSVQYANTPHTWPQFVPRKGDKAPRLAFLDQEVFWFDHCREYNKMVASNAIRNVYGDQVRRQQAAWLTSCQSQIVSFSGERNEYAIEVAHGLK